MKIVIHKNAFKGCSKLSNITLPNNVSAIGDCAFQNCSSLQNINIGNSVKNIGVSAFENDTSLSFVDRFSNDNPTYTFDTVGNYAFANTKLSSVNLALRSSSIYTFWGDGCFQNCNSLKNVHFLSANYMSKHMFKDCKQLSSVQFDVPLMAYTYPGIFDGCENISSICLPSQLLFIPENMFNNCRKLKSLTFTTYDNSSSIDEIQQNAFNNCNNINNIEFPSSINSLNELHPKCFSNMNSLISIKFNGIKSTQLLNESKYDIPASNKDIQLNTWYTFYDNYAGLYKTYANYLKSNIDNKDYNILSEEEYNNEVIYNNNNYTTISSIFQYAKDNNIPVVLTIGLSREDSDFGYSDVLLKEDITQIENIGNDGLFLPGEITPSMLLNITIPKNGTTMIKKTFKCKYLIDEYLYDAYTNSINYKNGYDKAWIKYLRDNNASEEYINTINEYCNLGHKKQVLKSIFINYLLDIGDFEYGNNVYSQYDNGNYSSAAANIRNTIKSRLSKICNDFTNKSNLNNSIFKYIKYDLNNTTSYKENIETYLKNYDYYGIIITKLNRTIIKTNIPIAKRPVGSYLLIGSFPQYAYKFNPLIL